MHTRYYDPAYEIKLLEVDFASVFLPTRETARIMVSYFFVSQNDFTQNYEHIHDTFLNRNNHPKAD